MVIWGVSNKSMSYMVTLNEVFTVPEICHCQLVPGGGTQILLRAVEGLGVGDDDGVSGKAAHGQHV